MRTCGTCTLCCDVAKVLELKKPANELCRYCVEGKGCSIYESRPKGCRDYVCLWLVSDMPERWQPNKTHLFVERGTTILTVRVDLAHPTAWQNGVGKELIEHLLEKHHLLIYVGRQLTFLPGKNQLVPQKILLDWVL